MKEGEPEVLYHNEDPNKGCIGWYDKTGYIGRDVPKPEVCQGCREKRDPLHWSHRQGKWVCWRCWNKQEEKERKLKRGVDCP